jgi:Polyketide cyclase / dehydrase and lipid transport
VRGSIRVAGPASPDQVWERYAVPERWPGWAPQISRVQASAPRIAPGVTGRVWAPLGLRVDFVVTEVDGRLRTWAWSVRLGPRRLRLQHGVQADPAGSATWLHVHGPAPVVAAYLPVARLALHRLVHAPS